MQAFFFSVHKHSSAFEQTVYEQIAYFPFKNVARLLNVHAHVYWRPKANVFRNVVDCLWESGWAVRSLQNCSNWRKEKNHMAHPNGTQLNVFVVFSPIFMIIVDEGDECLLCVSSWSSVMNDNSSQKLLFWVQ